MQPILSWCHLWFGPRRCVSRYRRLWALCLLAAFTAAIASAGACPANTAGGDYLSHNASGNLPAYLATVVGGATSGPCSIVATTGSEEATLPNGFLIP